MALYERILYNLYRPVLHRGRPAKSSDSYRRRRGVTLLLLGWHGLWGAVMGGYLGRWLAAWGWPALRLAGGWLLLAGAGLSLLDMAWLSPPAERLRQLDQAARQRPRLSRFGESLLVYRLFLTSLVLAALLYADGVAFF